MDYINCRSYWNDLFCFFETIAIIKKETHSVSIFISFMLGKI